MKKSLFLLPLITVSLLLNCGGNTPQPSTPVYSFNFVGTNCNIDGENNFRQNIVENETKTYLINLDPNYTLEKQNVTITGPGASMVNYDEEHNTIAVNRLTANVLVKAIATHVTPSHIFSFIGVNCKIDNQDDFQQSIKENEVINFQIDFAATHTLKKENIIVTGSSASSVKYNEETNLLTIVHLTSDVSVRATATLIPEPVNYSFTFIGKNSNINGKENFTQTIKSNVIVTYQIQTLNDYVVKKSDITITGAGASSVNYNENTKVLTIENLIGNVTVNATGVPRHYTISFTAKNCLATASGVSIPTSSFVVACSTYEKDYVINLYPNSNFSLPDNITVIFNQSETGVSETDYIYSKANQQITLKRKTYTNISVVGIINNPSLSFTYATYDDAYSLEFSASGSGDLIVDWGDGELTTNIFSHTYENYGTYVVKIVGPLTYFSAPYTKILNVDYSASMTSINNEAFMECLFLSSATISKNVTSIGASAFSFCPSLSNVILPDNSKLETIMEAAFAWCTELHEIKIPKSVTRIDRAAFTTCVNLSAVDLTMYTNDDVIPTLGEFAFEDVDDLRLYVRDADVKNKFISTSGWDQYADRFVVVENNKILA